MSSQTNPRALIVGGGIGGLTAALSLRRRQIESVVYESRSSLAEVGAGISLWPNATKALTKIGVSGLDAISILTSEGLIRRSDGTPLAAPAGTGLAEQLGGGVVVFHRAELLSALIASAADIPILPEHELTAIEEDETGVTARFRNGATARGDVLVGADGLRSSVRQILGVPGHVRYSGYTAWRSIVRFDVGRFLGGETWGCGRRFGFAPVRGGRVYWYATRNAVEGEGSDTSDARDELLSLFGSWHPPIPDLLDAAGDILRNDIYDRDPIARWGRGRITLLGDAAHPMTPDLGQGACQAIEDALELARQLANESKIERALRAYERVRTARTAPIVLASRRVGRLGQMDSALGCGARNLLLKLLPTNIAFRQLASVAGYEGHLAD